MSAPPSYDEATAANAKEVITKFRLMPEEELEQLILALKRLDFFNLKDPTVGESPYFSYHILHPMLDLMRGNKLSVEGLSIFENNLAYVFNLIVAYRNIIGWGTKTTEITDHNFCYRKIITIDDFDRIVDNLISTRDDKSFGLVKGLIDNKNDEQQQEKRKEYTRQIIFCLDGMLEFMKMVMSLFLKTYIDV